MLIAAIVLFGLFSNHGLIANKWVSAFLENKTKDSDQSLIVEESVKAQFEEIEKKLLEEGSYARSSDYYFLKQSNKVDNGFGGTGFTGNTVIGGIAFLGSNSPSGVRNQEVFKKDRSGIITYTVQAGDNLSYIADSFDVSTYTLIWANDLNYYSTIKPGDELTILPTSGVLHTVKSGENLEDIVDKYEGELEKTIAYNGFPADGSIDPGQKVIIPGGEKARHYGSGINYAAYYTGYSGPYSGKSRNFPWGQCTWYVSQKRYVPWNGHAKYWLSNARMYGLDVCFGKNCEPVPGAIIATNESWYGHVAYVEAVNGNYITVSEMHGVPYWRKGTRYVRTFKKGDWRIMGYIY